MVGLSLICAARIAKKGRQEADDEENKQKKDDSSSTSSDTLDYMHLGNDADDDNRDDSATVIIRSNPSAPILLPDDPDDAHDAHDEDDTNRIADERNSREDSGFLLSNLSWEGDRDDFEE